MEHGINITTADKGTYYFLAPSSAAKAEWMRSINSGIEMALKAVIAPRTSVAGAGAAAAGAAGAGAAAGGAAGAEKGAATPLMRAASVGALPELGACGVGKTPSLILTHLCWQRQGEGGRGQGVATEGGWNDKSRVVGQGLR